MANASAGTYRALTCEKISASAAEGIEAAVIRELPRQAQLKEEEGRSVGDRENGRVLRSIERCGDDGVAGGLQSCSLPLQGTADSFLGAKIWQDMVNFAEA
eukprot:s3522_g8.t1